MEELQKHTHDPKSPEEEHAYLHAHGIPHAHGHVHESQKAVINRLSRAIGHLEKVRRMVENGEDCSNVLIQLAAVRSALDNTGKTICATAWWMRWPPGTRKQSMTCVRQSTSS